MENRQRNHKYIQPAKIKIFKPGQKCLDLGLRKTRCADFDFELCLLAIGECLNQEINKNALVCIFDLKTGLYRGKKSLSLVFPLFNKRLSTIE